MNRVYRIIVQVDKTVPERLIQEIVRLPGVEEVQVGRVAEVGLPSMQSSQMSVTTDLRSRKAIYLPEAHQYTEGDPKITIAVLDTGVALNHPEFAQALLSGYDFVHIIDGAGKFLGDFLEADDLPDDEVGTDLGNKNAWVVMNSGRLWHIPRDAELCSSIDLQSDYQLSSYLSLLQSKSNLHFTDCLLI